MNPRLLRPSLPRDPDAMKYIASVQADNEQPLEVAVQKAITDFVVGCKRDGVWVAIKSSCILAGSRTLSGALIPLVGAAPTAHNFASGDYDRKTGLVGNGVNKFLDTNRTNDADPQDSQHLAVWASAVNTTSTTGGYIGTAESVGASDIRRVVGLGGPTVVTARSRQGATTGFSGTGTSTGLIAISRNNPSSFVLREGGVDREAVGPFNSSAPSGGEIYVFGLGGGALSNPSNARLAFYSVGESLNLAILDARVSALLAAIGGI